ncbi:MAG: hypothetical protein EZS28_017065, partial [Streblomastix strix]
VPELPENTIIYSDPIQQKRIQSKIYVIGYLNIYKDKNVYKVRVVAHARPVMLLPAQEIKVSIKFVKSYRQLISQLDQKVSQQKSRKTDATRIYERGKRNSVERGSSFKKR